MIRDDWNADIPVERIARVYGFPSENAVHQFVRRYRNTGFKYIRPNTQITQMWMDELTDSEATTAGMIMGSERHEAD